MTSTLRRTSVLAELAALTGIVVLLVIALTMIHSVVGERSERADTVRSGISASWGAAQAITGPAIVVPYHVEHANQPTETRYACFLPDELNVRGSMVPERRYRGIFGTVVFSGEFRLDGSFSRPDFSRWGIEESDILWNDARVVVGISDLRGVKGRPVMTWNGTPLPLTGGDAAPSTFPSGLMAPIPLPPAARTGERYTFTLPLRLNGSQQMGVVPVGAASNVELRSSWTSPSFAGAFLPETRSIGPGGFVARWNVSSVARTYPQRWCDTSTVDPRRWPDEASVRVAFVEPAGSYQQTDRALKYGVLFIVLTFLMFFLYEVLSHVPLHPVQYFLVGGALCLFYLLLLSMSEQFSFAIAYVIASAATVGLITAYGLAILRSRLRVAGLSAGLSALYGYLYVLLQLEDWALMVGSIGLFAILAAVMYLTRKIDWTAAAVRTEAA